MHKNNSLYRKRHDHAANGIPAVHFFIFFRFERPKEKLIVKFESNCIDI